MPLLRFTEQEILKIGLAHLGFTKTRQNVVLTTNMQRFRACYGTSPKACLEIFVDLQIQDVFAKPDIDMLLMTLKWLKCYPKEGEMAGLFHKNERTVRIHCWKYAAGLQELRSTKVSVEIRNKNN